ncbi:sensor histidine kinase [Algoriphagus chordae]|uniref:GHKL domain-containing protein n=1 Tax=Algoriphagus chordae TaxID=237019 RepID=A0A2W7RVK6_9BACT|nr:histidine kinase [Algoriphagus chordae]PZX54975.1 GHKL domain-containing protein [Algoriphagus chordae]
MVSFLKKYRAFGIGIILMIILRVLLEYFGVISVNPSHFLENAVLFSFWAFVISITIYKFSYLKERKDIVFKVLGLIVLVFVTLLYDSFVRIPDNPITFILVTTFWIGLVYLVLPQFFKKYRYLIIGVYILILAYFTFVRLGSESFEAYVSDSKERVLLLLVIPVPLFAMLWFYEQWIWLKSIKEGKAKAELELLKTQINPHFFFNTLNNLYSLTIKQSEEAPKVVLKLSDMMRYTIYEGKKETVSLKDEIEYLHNYIDLHKIRYKKKVDIQFTHNIRGNEQIAPLLFIILLENAIKHGLETLSENAFVHIELLSDEDQISFTISNNFERTETPEKPGIGLENLKRRLELIYPKKHTLSIEEAGNVFKAKLNIVGN